MSEVPPVDRLLQTFVEWIEDKDQADRMTITRKNALSIVGYIGMLEAALTAELAEWPKVEIDRVRERINSREKRR